MPLATAPPFPSLAARGITKRFGAFTALAGVDFAVSAGEVHALLGENGAGKSTLMNVLSGLVRPTRGDILLDGRPVRFASPREATAAGIGMVHQHFLLVPPLSVAENLLLGASPEQGGALSYPLTAVLDEARAIADRLGWQIPWKTAVAELPVGTQQRIEILKALRGQTRVLIFDEPTAVLSPTETPELFATIRRLAVEGRGIVFISHKLDEVLSLAQRVTVLRRGEVVHRTTTAETSAAQLAEAMVGGAASSGMAAPVSAARPPVNAVLSPSPRPEEEPVLEVSHLTLMGAPGRPRLRDIRFSVAPGEVFGVAGVDGNGQAELADCLAGLARPTTGTIRIDGQAPPPDPGAFRRAGVAVIPADRQRRGLALPLSLAENLALGAHDDPQFRRGPLLRWGRLRTRAAELLGQYDVRASGPDAPAASLSGGNQQKVVIARALEQKPRVLVAVNPTRGLDVGATAFVHEALRRAQRAGAAIVLISTELDEVLALATMRVAVLYEGAFSGIVAPDTPREQIGLRMGGRRAEDEP